MTSPVDVIIVNYNTRDDLVNCLGSLLIPRPASLARLIVVDNASGDGSMAAVRAAWPDVETIALDRNVGYAAANNIAMRQATAPLVLLLNSDTIVPAHAIDRLVERFNATGAAAAGPRLVDRDGRPEVSFGRMLSPLAETLQALRGRLARSRSAAARAYTRRLVSREREVDWVSGACLLVRRSAAVSAGLLDERYFMYEEDVDFCAALRARGGRILYAPSVEITHLRGRSPSDSGRQHYDRSHLAFYEKHRPGWAPVLRLWQRLHGRPVR
jgi:GT2 family glycosyltransferase